jgi:hypothetical protein
MRRRLLLAVLLAAPLLSGCAHTLNVLDDVRIGQSEPEVMKAMSRQKPARAVEGGTTKYLIWGYIATFLDMYSNTVTHYYVKLERGRVVDKGILRGEIIDDIRKIDPSFPLTR